MKNVNVPFEDKEHQRLLEKKGDRSWRSFILTLLTVPDVRQLLNPQAIQNLQRLQELLQLGSPSETIQFLYAKELDERQARMDENQAGSLVEDTEQDEVDDEVELDEVEDLDNEAPLPPSPFSLVSIEEVVEDEQEDLESEEDKDLEELDEVEEDLAPDDPDGDDEELLIDEPDEKEEEVGQYHEQYPIARNARLQKILFRFNKGELEKLVKVLEEDLDNKVEDEMEGINRMELVELAKVLGRDKVEPDEKDDEEDLDGEEEVEEEQDDEDLEKRPEDEDDLDDDEEEELIIDEPDE